MQELILSGGPEAPPAAGPARGLTDAEAIRYRLEDADADADLTIPLRSVDVVIEPGQLLTYVVFPELRGGAAEVRDGSAFAATAVAVELQLDDGSIAPGLVDQAGYPATPAGQRESRALTCDQWNIRRIDLAPIVGRRVTGIRLRASSSGTDASGWVSDVRIEHEPAAAARVDLVDTRRGTHSAERASRGNTIPAVAVPHGFTFAIPVTDAGSHSWPYRYHAGDALRLQALATSHAPSPWMGDRGVVQIMPTAFGAAASADREARALGFTHEDEHAGPHLWSADLAGGIRAELTTTDRVLVARLTLPDGGGFVIDQIDHDGRLVHHPDDRMVPFTGWTDSYHRPAAAQAPRMYFAIAVDRPLSGVTMGTAPGREQVSASVGVEGSGAVQVRIATSFIGIEQARATLAQEAPFSRSFDAIVAANRGRWEPLLDLVRVQGERSQQAEIASDLYRMFLYPNRASENAGTVDVPRWVHADVANTPMAPHGEAMTGCAVREGESFVNNGFWDTYRTVWPAYSFLVPEQAAAMLDGFVEHYRAAGWMERWSSPGPANAMVGTSSDIVLADAVAAGVELNDLEEAYDSALRNATTRSVRPEVGRAESATAPFRGYVSTATPEGLSWTLEGAINDFGIAALAERLAADPRHPRHSEFVAGARYFTARAASYVALFDETRGFFVGRDAGGRHRADFDPAVWGGDYTETNAWGMRFSVPHDGHGLATLLGGPDGLEAALDAYFATPETGVADVQGAYGRVIHEMTEARDLRMGMYGLSNQPAHHIPFMYAFTRAPHKADAVVRESVRRMFLGSEIGQGFPGDEDNGEMAAWHLFASIGLYPLTPASGEYLITSPSVPRAELRPACGGSTVISVSDLAPENVHIQAVRIDGEVWRRASVPIEMLRRGIRIDIDLGPEPVAWASEGPFSLSPPGALPEQLVDATPVDAGIPFDDSSDDGVLLCSGESVECRFDTTAVGVLYTVTTGAAGRAGWRLDGLVDGEWTLLDERRGEQFRWNVQTRPFICGEDRAVQALRFTALDDALDLRQLEFLHPATFVR
ncbi:MULTISPECIES: GH92 family glycosyl hydrolase [unclassified Microbacterium]|uniref:GH92 family glycosyl hydrolase n=1 Tax=unclassified Microbacterium TaxID=2609290 RepID=UPI0012F97AE9|nr:GH92 family glycosyl hydrolase [Microbacterium sp. MAH-37]MVQ41260.1 glycoside hydrolase family 92 protein [Microbacterium sp. MAH-37]